MTWIYLGILLLCLVAAKPRKNDICSVCICAETNVDCRHTYLDLSGIHIPGNLRDNEILTIDLRHNALTPAQIMKFLDVYDQESLIVDVRDNVCSSLGIYLTYKAKVRS